MFVSEGSGSVTNRRSETFRPRGFWDHRHAVFNGEDPRADSDQALDGLNLIGEATLNVLEPGGDHEITAVAEKRLYVGDEQIGF